MKIRKILALVMVAILVVALVGCGGKKREVIKLTLSTEDSEAILNAAGIRLPDAETAAGANSVVKWCAHYDPFQNYSADEIVNTGFYTFTEKYGGSLDWVEVLYETRWDQLGQHLLGGTPPDLFPGETAVFPTYVMNAMFAPINKYIDLDDPLWGEMKDYMYNYFSLGDNAYVAVVSADYGEVVPYNRRVINEFGLEDPAELYYNDEWTWDKFYEMCVDFSDPDMDRYALDGWYYSASLFDSSGKQLVVKDPVTGHFSSNVDDPSFERIATYLDDLNKNECTYPWFSNGWNCRNDSATGAGVKDGLCLFWIVAPWGFTAPVAENANTWGDTNTELMFVPLPRDQYGDGNYYMASNPNAFCIINGANNAEGAALIISCARFQAIDPVVKAIDKRQLQETYGWTEEMCDMADECYRLANSGSPMINYNAGYGKDLAGIISYEGTMKAIGHTTSRSGSTWAQLKEANADRVSYYCDELNAQVDNFIATGGAFNAGK